MRGLLLLKSAPSLDFRAGRRSIRNGWLGNFNFLLGAGSKLAHVQRPSLLRVYKIDPEGGPFTAAVHIPAVHSVPVDGRRTYRVSLRRGETMQTIWGYRACFSAKGVAREYGPSAACSERHGPAAPLAIRASRLLVSTIRALRNDPPLVELLGELT